MIDNNFFKEIQNLTEIAEIQLEQKVINEKDYLEIISILIDKLDNFAVNQSSFNFLKVNLNLPLKDIVLKDVLDKLLAFN